MAQISMTDPELARVTVGVDTHEDVHVARAKDSLGRSLGEIKVPASVSLTCSCVRDGIAVWRLELKKPQGPERRHPIGVSPVEDPLTRDRRTP